jgi:hypothetical protein
VTHLQIMASQKRTSFLRTEIMLKLCDVINSSIKIAAQIETLVRGRQMDEQEDYDISRY